MNHVLIVDDEDGPRQSLRVIFKDEYDLLMAEDGPTAIDLAQTAYCQLTHELAASMKARRRSDLCSPIPQAD